MATESPWKIKIKTLKSKNFELSISPGCSVDDLKKEIEKIKQIAPELQRIIYRGRILKSGAKLKDYDVKNGSTIHLVARKPKPETDDETQNNSNTSNTANHNPNPRSNAIPVPFNIQQMFQTLNNQQQMRMQSANGNPQMMGGPMPMPMPQMLFRRMPMNNAQVNTVRNVHDSDDNHDIDDEKQQNLEIKAAEYAKDLQKETAAQNLLKWKINKTKLQKWISNGKKYQSYFSEEQQLNNGSVWRFFVYPNGINQNGYHEDCVLFVLLEQLPFGVDAMDVEFALHCKSCNVHFKFRKTFSYFVRSAGWPRNFLLFSKILELPASKNFVKFTCDLTVHSVILDNGNKRLSNFEFIQSLRSCSNHPRYGHGSSLFRWNVDKKAFIDAPFKQYQSSRIWSVGGFRFYIHLYPNGLTKNGFVQPYLHLIKMPHSVLKIDAHFSFYFREINCGYSHVDMFNGKMGKGWADIKLKKDEVPWSHLKSITMDCRINILNVSVSPKGWFTQSEPINEATVTEEKKEESTTDESQKLEKDRELKEWLEKAKLEQYLDNFSRNEIRSLDEVSEYIETRNDLKEIGIKPFGHRVKMWKCIVKLKEIREICDDEPRTF